MLSWRSQKTGMRTALSTHMMHCTHYGPLDPQFRARHTPSFGVLGAETSKLSERRQSRCKRAKLRHIQTQASADVFALDFDGVLVDSEPEVRYQLWQVFMLSQYAK